MLARRALHLAQKTTAATAVWEAEESKANGPRFLAFGEAAVALFDTDGAAETFNLEDWPIGRSQRERAYRA